MEEYYVYDGDGEEENLPAIRSLNLDDDAKEAYDFSRNKFKELIEKQDEAIELMLEVARGSEHPRAFEVLSNMIKQNAEMTEAVLGIQKKKLEIIKAYEDDPSGVPAAIEGVKSLTQNNIFVGSTSDLQKMLQKQHIEAIKVINDNSISTKKEES